MHSFVVVLATAAAVSATYVEPYQASAKAYSSRRGDYMHTVVEYPTYQRRAVAYKPSSYETPSPYSSDPAEYPEPTPYPSEKPYDPKYEYEYSYSSSSSSMPAGSFIDNTGVADLADNLPKRGDYAKTYAAPPSYSSPAPTPYPSEKPYDPKYEYEYSYSSSSSSMPAGSFIDDTGVADLADNLPKRGDYAKTYAAPASYSSPAPTPYPSEKPYDPKYEYSYSSSSSSMPAGSFIDNTGVADLDNLLAGRGEYQKKYHSEKYHSEDPKYHHTAEPSYSYSYSASSSSSSAPAGSAGAAADGLGGLLGALPIRRHEPTDAGSQVPRPTASAQADPLGGILGDLPLA